MTTTAGRGWRVAAWAMVVAGIMVMSDFSQPPDGAWYEKLGVVLARIPVVFAITFTGMAFSLAGAVAASKAGDRRLLNVLPVYATTLFAMWCLTQLAVPRP